MPYHSKYRTIYDRRIFISWHSFKLLERCNCDTGYSIEYKNETIEAFQCKKCLSRINDIPLPIDGICSEWKIDMDSKLINNSEEVKRIHYIDPNSTLSNSTGTLTSNQKNALKNILFLNSLEECSPILTAKINDFETPIRCYHKDLIMDLHNKYGLEYCKNQYKYIMRWNYIQNISNVDFRVIACFYTIYELLLRRYVDNIYPINYGSSAADIDAEGNIFLEIAYSWRSWRAGVAKWKENTKSRDNTISNYIYKDLINTRCNDILNIILNDYSKAHQLCDLRLNHTEAYYSTYLIIEYENGNIELY